MLLNVSRLGSKWRMLCFFPLPAPPSFSVLLSCPCHHVRWHGKKTVCDPHSRVLTYSHMQFSVREITPHSQPSVHSCSDTQALAHRGTHLRASSGSLAHRVFPSAEPTCGSSSMAMLMRPSFPLAPAPMQQAASHAAHPMQGHSHCHCGKLCIFTSSYAKACDST